MTSSRFVRTTIPEKETLGEKLAKKRNSLHLSLKDVERVLRIPCKHLETLEEGRYSNLPPDVYVRGFLKSYSLLLGLDPKKMIELYKKELGLERKVIEAQKKSPVLKPLKTPKVLLTPKKIVIFSSIVGVLGVVLFIFWQIKILTAPPTLTLSNPSDNYTTNEDYVVVEGKTEREAEVFINDVLVSTNDQGTFREKVGLQNGVNLLKVKARNKMKRETSLERTVLAKLTTNTTIFDRSTYPLEMKITIGPNPAIIEILKDGEKVNTAGVMLPGSVNIFYAKESIEISTNNAGSTSITLNGKDLGPIGKEGESVKGKKYTK